MLFASHKPISFLLALIISSGSAFSSAFRDCCPPGSDACCDLQAQVDRPSLPRVDSCCDSCASHESLLIHGADPDPSSNPPVHSPGGGCVSCGVLCCAKMLLHANHAPLGVLAVLDGQPMTCTSDKPLGEFALGILRPPSVAPSS